MATLNLVKDKKKSRAKGPGGRVSDGLGYFRGYAINRTDRRRGQHIHGFVVDSQLRGQKLRGLVFRTQDPVKGESPIAFVVQTANPVRQTILGYAVDRVEAGQEPIGYIRPSAWGQKGRMVIDAVTGKAIRRFRMYSPTQKGDRTKPPKADSEGN